MEQLGRVINIFICIAGICLMSVTGKINDAKEITEKMLIAKTKIFYLALQENKSLTISEYAEYKDLFSKTRDYGFEMKYLKRRYFSQKDRHMIDHCLSENDDGEKIVLFGEEVSHHTHDKDCYQGHSHELYGCEWHQHEGSRSYYGGCYKTPVYDYEILGYHQHSNECMTTYYPTGYKLLSSNCVGKCSSCGGNLYIEFHSHPCSYCGEEMGEIIVSRCEEKTTHLYGEVNLHYHAPYKCGHYSGEPVYGNSYIKEYQRDCGKTEGWQCGLNQSFQPICSRVITDIKAVKEIQIGAENTEIDKSVLISWRSGEQSIQMSDDFILKKSGKESVYLLGIRGIYDTAKSTQDEIRYCEITVISQKETKCCSYGHEYNGELESCPHCAGIMTGLRIEVLRDMYLPGEEILLKVFLQFQDGTERESNQWTTDFMSYQPGIQEVSVFCENMVEKVKVEVCDESQTCSVCQLIYPKGETVCPSCYVTATGILADGVGHYGRPCEASVYVKYRDGHTGLLKSGYVLEGYHPYQEGTQLITVQYKGFSAQFTVNIKKDTTGEESGEEKAYSYEPDFGIMEVWNSEQIEEILQKKGYIEMNENSYISIEVFRKESNEQKRSLKQLLLKDYAYPVYRVGGEIGT